MVIQYTPWKQGGQANTGLYKAFRSAYFLYDHINIWTEVPIGGTVSPLPSHPRTRACHAQNTDQE
jgi:hypothetical protein